MAAARGVIDFRKARLLDPAWWRRCRMLLSVLQADIDAESLNAAYRFSLALVGNPGLEAKSFSEAQEAALQCRDVLLSVRRPWEHKPDSDKEKEDEYSSLRAAYVKLVGDPKDPAFQAREAEVLRSVEAEKIKESQKRGQTDEFRRRLAARR